MKFSSLIDLVKDLPCFDLAMVAQLSKEPRASLVNQLWRFAKAGKIVPLRRGLYVLSATYRKRPVVPAELASAIYHPSYLSTEWALSFHGVVPEGAQVLTSVTTRSPKKFQNPFGEFVYRHVKKELFFGAEAISLDGRRVLLASPEKALVDLWYLENGEWTDERVRQLRFANELLDRDKLSEIVARFGKPRLDRALSSWSRIDDELSGEEVEL
jgi:predicted transcriptional regulator of viral defense system